MGTLFGKDFIPKCADCQNTDSIDTIFDLEGLTLRSYLSYNKHREGKYLPTCRACGSEQIVLEFQINLEKGGETKKTLIQTSYYHFLLEPPLTVLQNCSSHEGGILHYMDLDAANTFRSQTYQWASGNEKKGIPLLLQRVQDSKIPKDQVGAYWQIFNWSVPNLSTRHDLGILGEWNDFSHVCRMIIPPQIGFFLGFAAAATALPPTKAANTPLLWRSSEYYLGGTHQIYIPKEIAQLCFEASKHHTLQDILKNPRQVFKAALDTQKKYEEKYRPMVAECQKQKQMELKLFQKCSDLEVKLNRLSSFSDAKSFIERGVLIKAIDDVLLEYKSILSNFPTLSEKMDNLKKKEQSHRIPKKVVQQLRAFQRFEEKSPPLSLTKVAERWQQFLLHNQERAKSALRLMRLGGVILENVDEPDDTICPRCGHPQSQHPVQLD